MNTPRPCAGLISQPTLDRPAASGSMAVSVVIPAKNEAANLPWVLGRMPGWVDEVVLVDGLSTDGTIEVAQACCPDVVVVHEKRPGKGAAVRAGLEAASGDIIAMLDADGSMDPQELGTFVAAVADGAGLAKGSRRMSGGGSSDITLFRDVGNRGLLMFANVLLQTRFTELCYGYMAVSRSVLPRLSLAADGFEIEAEIVAQAVRRGVKVTEVPSFEFPRRAGASNLNAVRDGLRIFRTLVQVAMTDQVSGRSDGPPAPRSAQAPVGGGQAAVRHSRLR